VNPSAIQGKARLRGLLPSGWSPRLSRAKPACAGSCRRAEALGYPGQSPPARAIPDKPSSALIRRIRADPCSIPASRGEARLRGLARAVAHRGRFFGKPLRAISRFSHQDAQPPPSPLVGEGGWGDEGERRTGIPASRAKLACAGWRVIITQRPSFRSTLRVSAPPR